MWGQGSQRDNSLKITFDEDGEAWRCGELEIEPAPKLATIKRRIDVLSRQRRSVETEALMLSRDYFRTENMRIVSVKVTTLCEPEEGREYRNETPGLAVRQCWAMIGSERKKLHIDSLYPLGARSELEAYVSLDDEWRQKEAEKDAALKAIPTHDADSLALAAKEKAAA